MNAITPNEQELLDALKNMYNLFERVHGDAIIGRPTRNTSMAVIKKYEGLDLASHTGIIFTLRVHALRNEMISRIKKSFPITPVCILFDQPVDTIRALDFRNDQIWTLHISPAQPSSLIDDFNNLEVLAVIVSAVEKEKYQIVQLETI